jgi:hypothetical protein
MSKESRIQYLQKTLQARSEIQFACLYGDFVTKPVYEAINVVVQPTEPPENPTQYAAFLSITLTRAMRLPVEVRLLTSLSPEEQQSALAGQQLFRRNET